MRIEKEIYFNMIQVNNPFVTGRYVSAEYFCDRENESKGLIRQITNGNNLALISTRRMGKTGLIMHCFAQREIAKNYYTFFVDIYATKSLQDFVFSLSRIIVDQLKPFGRKALETFINCVKTLQAGITFDVTGNPSFNLQLGDIHDSNVTLDEIFKYLETAGKPCIVAIDEFQQITSYPEDNVEALLRTHIQHSKNAHFIFAGSQRHVMGNMFLSASRPFYQSVSMMYLESINIDRYIDFVHYHFKKAGKKISKGIVEVVYNQFEGITWYIQKMFNMLFMLTEKGEECRKEMIEIARKNIIDSYKYNYEETLFRLPGRQKELLVAISKEGKAQAITSGAFVKKYRLTSPSSVQAALKGLLEKDFITSEHGNYAVYDKFFAIWLRENF